MHRIDHSTAAAAIPAPAAAGTPGYFTNGNPQTGTPATIPGADWANAVQEEICNVITGFGLALSKTTHNQMYLAIQAAVGGVGGGEVNTASNLGAGDAQVFASKVGADLRFRALKAGSNVTLTQTATEIIISAAGGGGGGVTDHGFLTGLTDDDHPQYLTTARGDARYAPIDSGGGGGEANTASNTGTGEGQFFKGKTGVDLQFKTLKAGAGVTITNNANEVQIDATGGGGGEANTASNLGTGEGIFASKSGVDLRFKTLKVGANADIASTSNDITLNPKVGLGANTFTDLQTATGFAVSSDARLKEQIEAFPAPHLQAAQSIRLYRWRWNALAGESLVGKPDSGVLAHEVEAVFPACVYVGEDGFKRIDYGKLAVHLLLADQGA